MSSCAIPQPKKSQPCSIHVPLFEGETGEQDFSTWPQAVQNLHTRELARWEARNPDLDVVDLTHSFDAGRRVCVTEFHYAARPVAAACALPAPQAQGALL
jgi:hypothetical protein